MKKSHLKFNVRRLTTCTAIVLAGMLASCSNDDVENKEPEQPVVAEGNTASLKLFEGASQAGRIKHNVTTKTDQQRKLNLVATVARPEYQEKMNWSATAIAFNDKGTKAYVTWHSDKQATNPAEYWGGAVDVIDIDGDNNATMNVSAYSEELKFNHVLYDNNTLFLSATSSLTAGTVGRLKLAADGSIDKDKVECIGFPGVSVNAVAKCNDDKLVAVSGYTGTYGTFAVNAPAQLYYEGTDEEKTNAVETAFDKAAGFGGKYVITEGDQTYVLYNSKDENAKIQIVGGDLIDLGVKLVSSAKKSELYDYVTGTWSLDGEEHDYYGKHVFAVKNGKAYVACGQNGLLIYDLVAKEAVYNRYQDRFSAVGVCADDKYVYVATGNGLRVYHWVEGTLGETKGQLMFTEYASEVEDYIDGKPVEGAGLDASTGPNTKRHSANFVAVNPETKDIYVAYGQSGVFVYRLVEE